MTLSSFKTSGAIIGDAAPLSWRSFIPAQPVIENYIRIFGELGFGGSLFNTVVVAIGQVAGSVVTASLAGYAFARIQFPMRNFLFGLCLLASFIPVEAILLPLYKITQDLGMVSTYTGLFVPLMFHPFGLFIMRQAFADLPNELTEASQIDGAGRWRDFWNICLPNVRPALLTLVIIQFIWSCNNYLWPLVAMQDPEKQVAQVVIGAYKSVPNSPMFGEMFAAATAVTLPLVLVAIVLQRHYVRGLVTTGLK
ncbi:carbohydrate ABC transporter permease [Paenarthrobacter sp. NPDC092416]|uniref:carbohydrate ABC transporter permease n=1 Tax=Paenarthrobacter sp. NPDC092416 TaxID=3364386 RepID=UPI00382D7E21